MKQVYFCLILSLFIGAAKAEKEPRAKTRIVPDGSVHFTFNHFAPAAEHKDSALIIFDKFNRTGAGVIYKVFSADNDHSIYIEGIPPGKYYVTIKGLGVHRDRQETIIKIKASKKKQVKICLQDSEEYDKSRVVIPETKPSPAGLSILTMKQV